MEIRDVIHGSIALDAHELPILDARAFQRLRQIRQLGFAEHSFPSATHNRYIHSLGALATASRVFAAICENSEHFRELPETTKTRLRAMVRLAALLHDVGHGPLSHTTEFTMPQVAELKLPFETPARQATHEDYTLKIILDSSLTPLLNRAGERFGFSAKHIAALIDPDYLLSTEDAAQFEETVGGIKLNLRPLLKQIISSELDADRMDYLRRDSLMAGVSYGQFDADWLISNLTAHVQDGKTYLALQHRALFSFEDFLISRFHMFLMVYFHYKSVVFDHMLKRYLMSPDCSYRLPAEIDAYLECDDAHLYSHLAKSPNEWARRITTKNAYRVLIELHSGIPATKQAEESQAKLIERVRTDLHTKKIEYLEATSTGELSKYHRKPEAPIFVRYDNHYSAPSFIPLEKCTDLFDRYEKKRSITRLYVAPEQLSTLRGLGRDVPLAFEDR